MFEITPSQKKYLIRMFLIWLILAFVFIVLMSLFGKEIRTWFSALNENVWRVTCGIIGFIAYSLYFVFRKKSR